MAFRTWVGIAALPICALAMLAAPPAGRVLLVSFDGLGFQAVEEDPVASELTALKALAARGAFARGLQPAYPSTTGNSHAALWTGAYGDRNGITSNENPVLPRAEHTFLERRSGFRSESLLAEPLWAAAARQGIDTVAHQTPQGYPFLPINAPARTKGRLVIVNHYQTRNFTPYLILRPANVEFVEVAWKPAVRGARRSFRWQAGPVTLYGVITADRALYLAESPDGARVRVNPAPLEADYDGRRALARHFSAPLRLRLAEGLPAAVYFRLFALAPDGGDFLLLQTYLQETGVFDSRNEIGSRDLVAGAGGLPGNGPLRNYWAGELGEPIYRGGDGTAERRYLEALELLTRQYNAYSRVLWHRVQPRLQIDYLPIPDEVEHAWLGLVRLPPAGLPGEAVASLNRFRRWGYRLVNQRLEFLLSLLNRRDHLLVTSDHGLAPVNRALKVNLALQKAGLLQTSGKGAIAGDSLAVHGRYTILLNTNDWKNGVIPASEVPQVLARVQEALAGLQDPESGKAAIERFFRPEPGPNPLGLGGPAGFDLYFEPAPGYGESPAMSGPVIEAIPFPMGTHGFSPLRPSMQAVLAGAGPRLNGIGVWPALRSVDVAPLVADLLAIDPPASAIGRSPLSGRNR